VPIAIADTAGATLPLAKPETHKTTVRMVAAEGPGCPIPNVPYTTG
jgi:hypothetical protein